MRVKLVALRWMVKGRSRGYNAWFAFAAFLCFPAYFIPSYRIAHGIHTPVGVYIAFLGALAVAVTLREKPHTKEKAAWVALIALLMYAEIRNLYVADKEQATTYSDITTSLKKTKTGLDQTNSDLQAVGSSLKGISDGISKSSDASQKSFDQTLSSMRISHEQDEKEFAGLIGQQKVIIDSQRELSERFSGRLVPGDIPTPANSCEQRASLTSTTLLFGNNNAQIVDGEMPTFQIGLTTILGFEKRPNSQDVYVSVDFRDTKNRILMRLNKNGTVSRTADLILLHPDKSTLLVEDIYGKEFFRVVYLNPHAFRISGQVVYCGKPTDLFRGMSNVCSNSKMGVIGTDPFPCPMQP